jgi:hypothetical protein
MIEMHRMAAVEDMQRTRTVHPKSDANLMQKEHNLFVAIFVSTFIFNVRPVAQLVRALP